MVSCGAQKGLASHRTAFHGIALPEHMHFSIHICLSPCLSLWLPKQHLPRSPCVIKRLCLQLRRDLTAVLEYPETEEDEEVDLNQLLLDGHIALSTLPAVLRIYALLSRHMYACVKNPFCLCLSDIYSHPLVTNSSKCNKCPSHFSKTSPLDQPSWSGKSAVSPGVTTASCKQLACLWCLHHQQ